MYTNDNLIGKSPGNFVDPESESDNWGGQTLAPPPFQLFASDGGDDQPPSPPHGGGAPIQRMPTDPDLDLGPRSSKKRDRDETPEERDGDDERIKKKRRIPKEKSQPPLRRSRRGNNVNYVGLCEEVKPKSGKEPNHHFYKPRNIKTDEEKGHVHVQYSGYEYQDKEAYFSASEESSEDHDPMKKKPKRKREKLTRRIHGRDLSGKNQENIKNRRGYTANAPGFESNRGESSSHLLADKHKGSGHNTKKGTKSWNIIPTSQQYNLNMMGAIEGDIDKVIGRGHFAEQVYPYFYESNDPELIREELKTTNPDNYQEVIDTMNSNNVMGYKAKRVKKIIYEVKTSDGRCFRAETGPDLALGSTDRKENDEEYKASGSKKKPNGTEDRRTVFQVPLKENKDFLVRNLAPVDESDLLWGDPSYRMDTSGFSLQAPGEGDSDSMDTDD